LVLGGDVDVEAGDKLRAAIDRAMLDRATSLDFDFTDVEFMDSTGLRLLAYANELTAAAGGSVRLLGASPTVVRLLEVTQLDSVIQIA
jgi:anti-anti-sigma factor